MNSYFILVQKLISISSFWITPRCFITYIFINDVRILGYYIYIKLNDTINKYLGCLVRKFVNSFLHFNFWNCIAFNCNYTNGVFHRPLQFDKLSCNSELVMPLLHSWRHSLQKSHTIIYNTVNTIFKNIKYTAWQICRNLFFVLSCDLVGEISH